MVILTKLNKEDFENILAKYSVGEYVSHKHMSDVLSNTLYSVETTEGKYVVKIFENLKLEAVEYQLEVIDKLREYEIPVVEIEGNKIVNYNGKNLILQKFIEGKQVTGINSELIKNMAHVVSNFHQKLINAEISGNEYSWTDLELQKKYVRTTNNEYLIEEFEKIDTSKLKKGIIHGDLSGLNLISKNNKLGPFFDLDDIHKDYLSADLGILIAHMFITPDGVDLENLQLFMQEYQKEIELNSEELKAIYYTIKLRLLATIAWFISMQKKHSDINLESAIQDRREKYRLFEGISLEKFLTIVNIKYV